MAVGPGKYDEACTVARESTGAKAIVLLVIGGWRGEGFSIQAEPEIALRLPELLEEMAAQIRADLG